MSNIIPSDLTKPGFVKDDIWMTGTIVRTRTRKPQGNDQAGKSQNKGKAKTKRAPGEGFEIHLCGGTTAADVLLIESWDASINNRLQQMAKKGTSMAFSNFTIKTHTEKTSGWTTSRLSFYGVLTNVSQFKEIDENPDWLKYHPLTTMSDLQLLPDGMLVCVAGRIMPPQPQKAERNIAGEQVPVTNALVRNNNDMIQISAWRNLADSLANLAVQKAYIYSKACGYSKTRINILSAAIRFSPRAMLAVTNFQSSSNGRPQSIEKVQ